MKPVLGFSPHLFLTKVNEVLQIDVLPVVDDGFIDHLRHFVTSLGREQKRLI